MAARILGTIDILSGILLLISRSHYPTFSLIFTILSMALLGKGLLSMI